MKANPSQISSGIGRRPHSLLSKPRVSSIAGAASNAPFNAIAPGVIRAEDLAGDAAIFQQLRPAMAAEIRESAQFTLVVAHDQNRPAHRFDRPVTADGRPFVGSPDDDPPARMNMLDFRAKEIRR